jgi:type II secretory pathway component GspD/PulD (secretin)
VNPTAPGNTQPETAAQQPGPNNGGPSGDGGAPPSAPSPTLPARGGYRVTGDPENLSVFAVSTDAQELFTAIAGRANLRLVIDDTVSRRITVNMTGKPARVIVNDIASAYGLSIADVEGVTMISEGIPRSPSSYLLSDIDSIPTKYVNAANARNLLPVFLQDYVKVNSEQNAVVLSAPTEVLGKFREDIAQFDIPASQILVELLLVELTDTSARELGLNFTWNNAERGGSVDPATGQITLRAIGDLPQEFSANLRALQEKGKARVRANPRIATVSGRRASIFVGRQRYVVTPIESERGGSRNFIDAGVRLEIVPYTGGQGQILVDVETEVSTLSAPDPVTRLPEKSTRTANTVVRVGDGQTIVIGGLTQQESRDVRTKVPILGDLPLLGPLFFQTRSTRTTQTELALFITPRILSDKGHLPAAEEQSLKDRFLNSDLSRPLPPAPPRQDPPLPASPSAAPPTLPEPGKP